MVLVVLALAPALLVQARPVVAADGAIGIVKTVTGACRIVRADRQETALVGDALYRQDVIETGADGALGLTLKDSSMLSLGANSRFELAAFEFEPHARKLSLISRLMQGTLSFITGEICKLAPDRVRVETPTAMIGVRGTRFVVRVGAAQ